MLREVINYTRSVDPAKRPVTFVSSQDYNTDRAVSTQKGVFLCFMLSDESHMESVLHFKGRCQAQQR